MTKPLFKRMDLGMECWYISDCGNLADGTLNFVNGDEIPCCLPCALKKGKLVRIRRGSIKTRKKPHPSQSDGSECNLKNTYEGIGTENNQNNEGIGKAEENSGSTVTGGENAAD